MDFATSSHCNKWVLSQAQLQDRAAAANAAGISHAMELRTHHAQPTEGLHPLTVDEEAKLVLYYTHMLTNQTVRKLCPHKVSATAVTFMKRFYLDQSAMEHDTLRIALCCLYIAGKACEHYMDAGAISEVVRGAVKAKELLDLEATVLQRLHFELVVYEPFACIDAMIQEVRVAAREEEPAVTAMLQAQPEALALGHKLAYSFADSILQSSAPLTMRPQQQALCATCHALRKYGMERDAILDRYVRAARGSAPAAAAQDDAALKDALQATLAEGDRLAEAGHRQVSKEEVAALDRKVRAFNPLMDMTSELYKQLKSSKKKRKRKDGDA